MEFLRPLLRRHFVGKPVVLMNFNNFAAYVGFSSDILGPYKSFKIRCAKLFSLVFMLITS